LAHKAVSACTDFKTTAGSLKDSLRGTLRVGTILDPEFTRLGPFIRSLATSAQKTEVFLRYGMSGDVLAQIGKGELDAGYYIDATPPESLLNPTYSERTIGGGKFQFAPLLSYDYRVIAPVEWADKVMGKDWADLARLPWLATPPAFAHQRLLDDIFRPLRSIPKRVAYTDQEEAMIDFVESGVCLSLARDSVLEQRLPHKRNFVIADRVTLTCDLGFACLTGRRHEGAISHAFAAMQAVWDVEPVKVATAAISAARISAARSRKPAEI